MNMRIGQPTFVSTDKVGFRDREQNFGISTDKVGSNDREQKLQHGPVPQQTGTGGRIPLNKFPGSAGTRSKLYNEFNTQKAKSQSAQRGQELNGSATQSLKQALEIPGLHEYHKSSIEDQLKKLEASRGCDHLTAIQRTQQAQHTLDYVNNCARLGMVPSTTPEQGAKAKALADQLGTGLTKDIQLAMAENPSSQRDRQPPAHYPPHRGQYERMEALHTLAGRSNKIENDQQRAALDQDSIANNLMEIRDSHKLSPEQKAQVEQHLEKLGTKEMTDLERADAKNFARNLREEVAEQGPGGGYMDPSERARAAMLNMFDEDEEEEERKKGQAANAITN